MSPLMEAEVGRERCKYRGGGGGVNRGNYAEQRFIPLTLSRTRVLFEPWLTRRSNWCPMTGRKGEDLLNVLTF